MIKIGLVGDSGCAGVEFLQYLPAEMVAITSRGAGVLVPDACGSVPTWLPQTRGGCQGDGRLVAQIISLMFTLDETAGLCQHPL